MVASDSSVCLVEELASDALLALGFLSRASVIFFVAQNAHLLMFPGKEKYGLELQNMLWAGSLWVIFMQDGLVCLDP